MTRLGEVAKGILIFICGYYLFVMIGNAVMGQTALSLFMLIGFLLPFSYITYEYAKDKKRKKTAQFTA